jgi:hypothetical protein
MGRWSLHPPLGRFGPVMKRADQTFDIAEGGPLPAAEPAAAFRDLCSKAAILLSARTGRPLCPQGGHSGAASPAQSSGRWATVARASLSRRD